METGGKDDGLRGTTLKVYRYIVSRRNEPVRITEVQTKLGLSSPSLAHYHVKKLVELGLVREEGVGYTADKVAIENFFLVGGLIVPYQAAYLSFFCVTLVAMLIILVRDSLAVTSITFIALVVNVGALAVSAYELRRALRGIP
jgi:predicted transcriptional regulator